MSRPAAFGGDVAMRRAIWAGALLSVARQDGSGGRGRAVADLVDLAHDDTLIVGADGVSEFRL